MTASLDERVPSDAPPVTAVSGAPIFLTGFARSGTTWVNRLMQDYFDAGFVNEGQFIVTFGNRIQRYGDLSRAGNRRALLDKLSGDEFFAICKRNYGVRIDWNVIRERCDSFSGIVTEILSQIAAQTGKQRIGSKYPVFGRYLGLLNQLFPDCRVIHVIRDGRDCALSHERMRWGHQNVYSAAVHWRRYMETAQRDAVAMQGRYLEVRYEDLLLKPEIAVQKLEHFVTGTDGNIITKRFLENRASLKTDKVGHWREVMPSRSQAIFEFVAGDTLERHGYPINGEILEPSALSRAAYMAHDRLTREGWHLVRKTFKGIPAHK